jgi:muramoyltetrapeptide carboxypeptidase
VIRKPAPLATGDRVALVATSGPCDAARLSLGAAILESWGLQIELPPALEPLRYLATADEQRARALTMAFERDDVRAVLCVRGGYGAARLHDRFDVAVAVANPKLFVGFSDVTVLLCRLVQEAGLVCYHGPMVAADLPRLSDHGRERFRRFLFGEDGWWDGRVRETWRPGDASGRLVGGCLSVLVTTLGTPYEVATDDRILFLEDVAEKPYRVDRMLTHMKHAGKFDRARGVVLGPMADCDGGSGPALLRDIVTEVLAEYDFPILFGLDAGHGSDNVVLPFGCQVRLDGVAAAAGVELLEPVFAT